jgi:hypothetical protein
LPPPPKYLGLLDMHHQAWPKILFLMNGSM